MYNNNHKSSINHDIALDYSAENTFLSLIRTCGMMCGIAIVLIKQNKMITFVKIFILFILLSLIWATFEYSKHIYTRKDYTTKISNLFGINSINFAILLCLMLGILLFSTFN
jgi:hypothetical protein